jgi:hypothetical protein
MLTDPLVKFCPPLGVVSVTVGACGLAVSWPSNTPFDQSWST